MSNHITSAARIIWWDGGQSVKNVVIQELYD